jgi:hypothetical protein
MSAIDIELRNVIRDLDYYRKYLVELEAELADPNKTALERSAIRASIVTIRSTILNLEARLAILQTAAAAAPSSAATTTAQAQVAREDYANPGSPAPPVPTVQTTDGRIVTNLTSEPTNARTTPSEQTGALTTGTDGVTVPLTVSQSISSPPASGPIANPPFFNPTQDPMQQAQARAQVQDQARTQAQAQALAQNTFLDPAQKANFNQLQTQGALPTTAPQNSGTQAGVGAGNEDAAQPTTNATQNRLSELYGGPNAAIIPQDNVLDQYANYTYSLSWYLLDPTTYNNLILLPNRNLTGYYLLAQSGGAPVQNAVPAQTGANGSAGSIGVGRSPFFPLDYYLDNLEFDSFYPGTGSGGATKLSTVNFTVTEPNGISLLKNLYSAVTNMYNTMNVSTPGEPVNYLSAQYCMVIRFYGYDTAGNLVQPIAQRSGVTDRSAVVEKFIPFTITGIDFKVANKLVEYSIKGAGVEQVNNYSTIKGSIPQNFTFNGATVKDILVGSITQPTASTAAGDQTRNNVPIQSSPPGNNNVQDPAQRAQAARAATTGPIP